VRVVDSGKMDALMIALDRLTFVKQHADAHLFQSGQHADRVVIS
jgi:hypothetical protein